MTENFEHVDKVLSPDDMEQVNKVVKEQRERLKALAKQGIARPSMVGVCTESRGSEIDIEWAKSLKPPRTTLSKDEKLFWRWKGHMSCRKVEPKTVSKVWVANPGVGEFCEHGALTFVLKTLWDWSEEVGGPKMPISTARFATTM